ncbi:site-specific integrase [Enterococcus avium]|uniref:Site-specific integrase n=1 Tax=Enterococcus avium TaxID=33945 RepID=A0ABD5F650_ENTAV|nr:MULTISPECIES: site-specific integrase [Enterococcus]AUJ84407.1 site-specific integrase [Enterococcus sp. CR-Ec1]MDT2514002.1 site-specific integrase [Enterococcus avium]
MAKISKYKKNNGQVAWMFKGHIATDPRTGEKVNTTRRGFKTKQEAQKLLDELAYEIKYGTKKKITDMTFADLYEEWIDFQRSSVKKSTIGIYVRYAKNQILPEFGNLKITDITVSYCQKVVNKWHKKYKTYDTMRKQTAQILSYGISQEYIERNVMRNTRLPRRKEQDEQRKFYTKEELNTLLDAFKDFGNTKQYAYFRLVAYTGMRKSEALALQWKDIDVFNKELHVNKTVAVDEYKNIILQTPKTKASRRTISLDTETLAILNDWRIQQRADYLKLGYNTNSDNQYVFTSLKNTLYVPNTVNDWLRYILKKYTLPRITPHGFRHTHASLLLEAGESVKVVQHRLGHENSKVTLDIYAHITNNAPKKTGQEFADMMAHQ